MFSMGGKIETSSAGKVNNMNWQEPYLLRDWLSQPFLHRDRRPPESDGIYVLSERHWNRQPEAQAGILYVGQAQFLRDRIGRLVAEILGFTGDNPSYGGSYYHSGGHRLWHGHCLKMNTEPIEFFLGWYAKPQCLDCGETGLIRLFSPPFN